MTRTSYSPKCYFSLVGQVITWHSSDGRADNNCTNEFYQPRTRRVYTPGFGQVLMPCYLQVRRTSASQISWQPLLLYPRNAGMGGPIDMEWKGYKSIGCYTYQSGIKSRTLRTKYGGRNWTPGRPKMSYLHFRKNEALKRLIFSRIFLVRALNDP